MPDLIYCLDDTQAKYFAEHKEGVIVVPLEKQPPNNLKTLVQCKDIPLNHGH